MILAGIGVLAVISIALFFLRRSELTYGSENTPEGVVQNYILALHGQDHEQAYSYIAEIQEKPSFSDFKKAFVDRRLDLDNLGVKIGDSEIIDGEAHVSITVIQVWDCILGEISLYSHTAELVWESKTWKIKNLPYPYWFWDWHLPPPPELMRPVAPEE